MKLYHYMIFLLIGIFLPQLVYAQCSMRGFYDVPQKPLRLKLIDSIVHLRLAISVPLLLMFSSKPIASLTVQPLCSLYRLRTGILQLSTVQLTLQIRHLFQLSLQVTLNRLYFQH